MKSQLSMGNGIYLKPFKGIPHIFTAISIKHEKHSAGCAQMARDELFLFHLGVWCSGFRRSAEETQIPNSKLNIFWPLFHSDVFPLWQSRGFTRAGSDPHILVYITAVAITMTSLQTTSLLIWDELNCTAWNQYCRTIYSSSSGHKLIQRKKTTFLYCYAQFQREL